MGQTLFRGLRVAVVPFPALGDLTIYLRLSQAFHLAGARVDYYSNQLAPAAGRFDWLSVKRLDGTSLREMLSRYDLVIWDAGARLGEDNAGTPGVLAELVAIHRHLAVVTSKKLPDDLRDHPSRLVIGGQELGAQCAAFCQDDKAGMTMVGWVDRYAERCFGLAAEAGPPSWQSSLDERRFRRKAVLFPTTPNPRKNYWLRGFGWIAHALAKSGWDVSLVVMPSERAALEGYFPGCPVRSFDDLDQLIGYLDDACIAISNDSGGGHLASMMGMATVTITRKPESFVWRPGFNDSNVVLSPLLTFKGRRGHVWRPFVPYWRVPALAEHAYRARGEQASVTPDAY